MTRRQISLKGLTFHLHHGAYAFEKTNGQPFVVDVDAQYDFGAAAASDALKDAIDYRRLYVCVKDVLEGRHFRLIEAMSEAVGRELLENFPRLSHVSVRVTKPWAPLGGLSEGTVALFEASRE